MYQVELPHLRCENAEVELNKVDIQDECRELLLLAFPKYSVEAVRFADILRGFVCLFTALVFLSLVGLLIWIVKLVVVVVTIYRVQLSLSHSCI